MCVIDIELIEKRVIFNQHPVKGMLIGNNIPLQQTKTVTFASSK